ncbi:MAG TPA: GWxTD domain-containing protein [Bacteroidetes bacterium]|nr:GWxTD domain-containing protein [Bacteroidota bacterium]
MKKSILVLTLLIGALSSKALDANISYSTFKSADGNYIEVYLHFVAQTMKYKLLPDSTLQASAEVVITFKKNGAIVKFDKYILSSPASRQPQDFVDLKRYGLENGDYKIEVSVADVNDPESTKRYDQTFKLDFSEERVYQSDILLLASLRKMKEGEASSPLAKGGYIFEPLPSQFYDKFCDKLIFYDEIYDTDKLVGEDFLVSYRVLHKNGQKSVKAIGTVHKKRSPAGVVPFLQQIDISKLLSGNYELLVEVKNRKGDLLSKKSISFQRSNPFINTTREQVAEGVDNLENEFVADLSLEELRYSLKAIAMQIDDTDGKLLNTIIAEKKEKAMRLYLFSFWARESPTDPEGAYRNYMKVAKAIDEKFGGGFGYGFETDRGYIYMKYGVPNDIVTNETEQSAPPYQMWFYNEFPQTGQNNVKFLFYNPSLSTNGYVLLHSNARGEVNNPRWEVELYSNAPGTGDVDPIDGTSVKGGMGRHARRLWESY